MSISLEQLTKEAMDLSPREKLGLAGLLLESAEVLDAGTEAAWDAEIHERIRAVEEGRTQGISYEEVMRVAESRLAP